MGRVILELVWAFMQVGITAFGGGLSTLPLIEYQLVTKNAWMTAEQFNQMVAVSQVTPGPIAINAATFAGYEKAGVIGSFAATLALVAAPVAALCVVLAVLKRVSPEGSRAFKMMLRPVVAGLLTLSLVSPFSATLRNGFFAVALFCAGVLLIKYCKFFKDHPAAMLVSFGAIGAIFLS
ncbi:MAG: chromate transporter [Cloacibacillus sp.]